MSDLIGELSARDKPVTEHDLLLLSIERIKGLNFGDPVTNICAGENNPMRLGRFVEYKIKSRKNRAGIVHREHLARITYGNGKFANIGPIVIYPGHLSYKECEDMFDPIHRVLFPDSYPSTQQERAE